MPRVKAIEARLAVTDVARSVAFFGKTLGFNVATLWPEQTPQFAILDRDGLRLQIGKDEEGSRRGASATLWLDVEDLAALHAHVKVQTNIEWGPEVYSYGRREFGFRDPDGHWVILSEVTSDPPTCVDN
jgi:catechol 2,3-dioxygenase-like lactoylglutathione lyase family enzyme